MLPPKDFYLMRHGETLANTQKITCGLLDSVLTEHGKNQAALIANKLLEHNIAISKVFCSHLIRSMETANIVASHIQAPCEVNLELHEHNFGEWDGLPWATTFSYLEKGLLPPGGESREQFIYRTMAALKAILSDDNSSKPLIVAHGGTFFAFCRHYKITLIEPDNCQLYVFKPQDDDSWKAFPAF